MHLYCQRVSMYILLSQQAPQDVLLRNNETTQTVEDGLPTLARLYEREAKEIVYKIRAYSFLK